MTSTIFFRKICLCESVFVCAILGVYKVGGEGGRGAPSSRTGYGSQTALLSELCPGM